MEFGLVLLPLLGFLFLIMDVAWICFAKASLQYAVQAGVRSAISSYLPQGISSQDGYIKSVVQSNAMGFLAGQNGLDKITINYYAPSNLSTPVAGLGSNGGGNVVEVVVSNVKVSTLGPIFRESWATMSMNASSSDIMESSPGGVAPKR